MDFLPNLTSSYKWEKVNSYLELSRAALPVFKSVLLETNEHLSDQLLLRIAEYLGNSKCTLRYQYILPCNKPMRGGTLVELESIHKFLANNYRLWLMEPINRTRNLYGINTLVSKTSQRIVIEIVGTGFDISDINRGDITPHQIITLEYPIRWGYQREWWKFITLEVCNENEYLNSISWRRQKLNKASISFTDDIFQLDYKRLPICLLEKLLDYITAFSKSKQDDGDFVISSSIDDKGCFVFWDVQTPKGKTYALMSTI